VHCSLPNVQKPNSQKWIKFKLQPKKLFLLFQYFSVIDKERERIFQQCAPVNVKFYVYIGECILWRQHFHSCVRYVFLMPHFAQCVFRQFRKWEAKHTAQKKEMKIIHRCVRDIWKRHTKKYFWRAEKCLQLHSNHCRKNFFCCANTIHNIIIINNNIFMCT